ncbi:hypothetical protein [Plantactinospora sonchi]|uniref:Uncharacterized protein n=1 Tax=Plantactinospora sonchi TaxID=1544735 RepID=A0ABU7RQJ8_9ACTN
MEELRQDEVVDYLRHGLLRNLQRSSEDEMLREIADAVLSGHITLREALGSRAYGEALGGLLEKVGDDPDALSPEAQARYAEEARGFEERLATEQGITIIGR